MAEIDPYQILGVAPDASLDVVKEAYRQLALKHHSDKDGNPETFKIIKSAFKLIVDNIKKGTQIPKNAPTFTEMKKSAQDYVNLKMPTPQEFFGQTGIDPNRSFDNQTFNQKFIQQVTDNDETAINHHQDDYRENRTKEQLLAEQQAVNSELSKIQPIFTGREFNNNVFQRLFEQLNGTPEEKTKALQVYEEPDAVVASGLQAYTEIDADHKTKQSDRISPWGIVIYRKGLDNKTRKR